MRGVILVFVKISVIFFLVLLSFDIAFSAQTDLEKAVDLRLQGKYAQTERLLKKYSSPAGFEALKPSEKLNFMRGLLELAHVRALKNDVPGALVLLNWAEGRKDPFQRSLACVKYAEILIDMGEFERASGYLKNADELIIKRAVDKDDGAAIGQGGAGSDTGAPWRELRDESDALKAEIEAEQMKQKFGATYGNYVKLRRLQRLVKRSRIPRYLKEALRVADEIIETDPASQFAAAAGYLKGEVLASQLKEQSPKKDIKKVKAYLDKFIKQQPDGLYRGEALMLLGKISLEIEWNAKDAEKYYSQALEWFRKAREKRDAVSLYAAINDDLKTQTAPTQRPTTLNQWKRTVYHDEDPLKLYNTANAPVWYVDEKELELVYMTGFFAFMRKDFQEAKKIWEQVPKLSSNIRNMPEFLPSIYTRLMHAIKEKHFYMDDEEASGIEKNLFLMFQSAQFLLWRERYLDAETLFEQVYKKTKNDEGKAAAVSGIAYCRAINLKTWDNRETVEKYYLVVINNKKLHGKPIVAYALYKYIDYLYNFPNSRNTFHKYIKTFKKTYKKSRHYCMVLARETNAYSLDGEFDKAWATARIIRNELKDEDLYKGVVWGINAMKKNYDEAKNKSK